MVKALKYNIRYVINDYTYETQLRSEIYIPSMKICFNYLKLPFPSLGPRNIDKVDSDEDIEDFKVYEIELDDDIITRLFNQLKKKKELQNVIVGINNETMDLLKDLLNKS